MPSEKLAIKQAAVVRSDQLRFAILSDQVSVVILSERGLKRTSVWGW
jgi:hypothetical protein